jgi:cysteinyl-tRNA synthetase
VFLFDVMGIKAEEKQEGAGSDKSGELIEMLIGLRAKAKANKDFALSDELRDNLAAMNIIIKDTPQGTEWSIN